MKGKPVILWTAERIKCVVPEFPLFFAVDDAELEAVITDAGYQAVMTRSDHPSGTDRLAEANAMVGADAVINVQGDEPLVSGEQIRALADGLARGVDMATLAVPFDKPEDFANPNQVKVVRDHSGLALYFSRAPIPYVRDKAGVLDSEWLKNKQTYRHLGLYAYTAKFLSDFSTLQPSFLEVAEKLEQLRALEYGYKIHVGLTDQPTIGIDAIEDIGPFERALEA